MPLKARNGEKTAGHSVVMTVLMHEVKIMATYHVWIQRGVSYFVTILGSAEACEEKCLTNF